MLQYRGIRSYESYGQIRHSMIFSRNSYTKWVKNSQKYFHRKYFCKSDGLVRTYFFYQKDEFYIEIHYVRDGRKISKKYDSKYVD